MVLFREKASELAACVFTLTGPAYIALFLRCYVRLSRGAWGADDWCLVPSGLLFLGCVITSIAGAISGVGVSDALLSPQEMMDGAMWWTLFTVFYCSGIMPIKLSIGFTILRIAKGRKLYEWTLYGIMASFSIVTIVTVGFVMFQCRPFVANWDKTVPGASCISAAHTTNISYALSSTNIITDWACAIIPIPLLWNTQMNKRYKCSVAGLLGLGVVASIAAIVRLQYTIALSATSNFLYNVANVNLWAFTEAGLGIIVASISALRPLVDRWMKTRSSSGTPFSDWPNSAGPSAGNKRYSKNDNYISLNYKKKHLNSGGQETKIESQSNGSDDRLPDDASDKALRNGIRVQQDYGVGVHHV
ncbi:hypothetical protein FQN54_009755 [Arachnomyces sp. PD_36]|nr:hypothetical protein FQN54_009755 [Arachnomyces sp. PD_36]